MLEPSDIRKILDKVRKFPYGNYVPFVTLFCTSLFFNIVLYSYIIIRFKSITESIIVQYSVNTGLFIDAPFSSLYTLPVVGTFFLIINTIFALLVYRKKKIIAMMFLSTTICIQCLLLVIEIALDRVNL